MKINQDYRDSTRKASYIKSTGCSWDENLFTISIQKWWRQLAKTPIAYEINVKIIKIYVRRSWD